MLYRRFGRTELQIPVFSCGGMRYQHGWQDVPLDEIPDENQANLEATIQRSIELGINHIETARGYGPSERQLGLILPKLPRDEIIVQTKVPPQADADQFVRDVEDSLTRLQLDYVDLFAFHGINNHRHLWYAVRDGGCLPAARELQKQGKIRHIGFSTHGDTEIICDAINCDRFGGFDYVNLHYYYIFQNHQRAIEAATAQDMGVFIISPADKGGMLYKPSEKLLELCAPLHPIVFNCLWCLRDERIHTLSLGASQPSDFDIQVSALEYVDRINEVLPDVEARVTEALHAAVGKDYAEGFAHGLAGPEDQPGHMAVETVLWLRNLVLAYDMLEYAKMRYQLLGNAGSWFYGNNALNADVYADALTKRNKDNPFAEKIPTNLSDAHQMLWEAPKQRLSES